MLVSTRRRRPDPSPDRDGAISNADWLLLLADLLIGTTGAEVVASPTRSTNCYADGVHLRDRSMLGGAAPIRSRSSTRGLSGSDPASASIAGFIHYRSPYTS